MDLTTNEQRARWAVDALLADAYVRRKFSHELADISKLVNEPREAASALRSSGEAVAWRYRDDVRPGLPWFVCDDPNRVEQMRVDGGYDIEPLYLHPATPASAWRPIAEAPLNESLLLLGWNNGNPANGAHIVIGSNWHGRWVDRGMDEANRDLGNTLAYIEYFQALPTPPTSTKGG